jgi:hypothetical protein
MPAATSTARPAGRLPLVDGVVDRGLGSCRRLPGDSGVPNSDDRPVQLTRRCADVLRAPRVACRLANTDRAGPDAPEESQGGRLSAAAASTRASSERRGHHHGSEPLESSLEEAQVPGLDDHPQSARIGPTVPDRPDRLGGHIPGRHAGRVDPEAPTSEPRAASHLPRGRTLAPGTGGRHATTSRDQALAHPRADGCAFSELGPALEAARNGDTVHVAAGTYLGGVTIDASIKVQGAGAGKTIVQGGGPVLTIGVFGAKTEPTVVLEGLTITGGVTHSSPVSNARVDHDNVIALGGGVEIPPSANWKRGASVTIQHILGARLHAATLTT